MKRKKGRQGGNKTSRNCGIITKCATYVKGNRRRRKRKKGVEEICA